MGTTRVVIEVERRHQRVDVPGAVWCSTHDMHPADCFDIHHPLSSEAVRTQIR